MNLWGVFEAAATRFTDRTAIEIRRAGEPERWSYRRLHDAAVAVSGSLIAHGIGAGDRCAILADNDAAWCAAYLGILRTGAIAVPLDTNYSPAQVAAILGDARPRVLFVNARLRSNAEEGTRALGVRIADVHETPEREGDASLTGSGVGEHDPAVILYTSGTTADPKGVVLTHGNLMAERDAAFKIISVTERDSVLGVLPLFHALAQLANLLLPLSVGARVVFLESVNSAELVKALAAARITIFACVPQFFYLIHQRVMSEVSRRGALGRLAFRALLGASFRLRRMGVNAGRRIFRRVHVVMGPDMRLFVTGGSKFDPAIGRDFYALGFTILQAYGLTETSGAATVTNPDDAFIDTVGGALPGQELKTLPPDDVDLDGEIAIRGPIVMQGYYNRPAATADVMRDGWFLTGDLGRLDAAGRLTITGRKKEIIVLASGKNIYPEEIENYYRRSAFVKEICVVGLTDADDPTTERLFAVVVPDMELMREKKIVNAGDLLRFELEGQAIHLPPHKRVLGYDVWFEPLPRTTTGKLKRHEIERRLREKRRAAADPGEHASSPAAWAGDSKAEAVAAVIARRARNARVSPESNLELDLGLDSMERVELITELEQRFGVRLPEDQSHQIFTAGQLVDAMTNGTPHEGGDVDDSWGMVLRDLPRSDDPVLGALLNPRPFAGPLVFLIARLLRVFGPPVEVSGLDQLPREGPFIISPNHQSYVDPFIVTGVLPFRVFTRLFFVGAAEYFETPFMRWLAGVCNLVAVDPDANLLPAMKASAFGLAHDKVLMLFPEGERSIDGTVKRFKKGAPILSRALGVPIVPVALKGAYEIWPRNRGFNWQSLIPGRRRTIRISIGAPVRFDGRLTDVEAATALRNAVEGMWSQLA